MSKRIGMTLAWLLLGLTPALAGPLSIVGDPASSTSGLGNFTGLLTYTASDASNATLVLTLTNTTPGVGGYLTGFVLNNPGNAFSSASLSASDSDFTLLGLDNDDVSGAPFGQFDVGAAVGGSFEGGGDPSLGVAVGNSATFTFTLAGTNVDLLNEQSFVNTLSVGPGDGEGHEWLVVRFRGMDGEPGSDKVPADPNDAPEPSSLLLAGLALGILSGTWARKRSQRAALAG